jgi:hypothetical protein
MQGLADFIDSADSEILLSLQYLEMDWYWGWQENPLLDSLEDAAGRGVAIRLAINQHYVDENDEIREVVNELNNWEGDVEAILMSENDTVKKLHNKGVIIDGESVLISSINWGDNSILRNREMGLIIHSQAVTAPFEESFWEDWNRLDLTTDSDIDGIPDYWEVENNLSRTNPDSDLDPDGDGLSNIGEFSYGSNPYSNDTDGDCINDGNEILWAATNSDVSAGDAVTMADADNDGQADSEVIGCVPDTGTGNNGGDNNSGNDNTTTLDSDGDGILDDVDECPDTVAGAATDTQGCSNEQNKKQVIDESGEDEGSSGMTFMLTLITIGLLVLVGSGTILLTKKKEPEDDDVTTEMIDTQSADSKNWEMPVLDGSSEGENAPSENPDKFPGWSEEQVQKYLDSGWSEEQLSEWYQQQVEDNSSED